MNYDINEMSPRPWTQKYYDYWYDANGVCFYDIEHEGGFHRPEDAIGIFNIVNTYDELVQALEFFLRDLSKIKFSAQDDYVTPYYDLGFDGIEGEKAEELKQLLARAKGDTP